MENAAATIRPSSFILQRILQLYLTPTLTACPEGHFPSKNKAVTASCGSHNAQCKHLIGAAEHGGGDVIIWARFAATGTGHLAVVELTMNASVYQSILKSDS